MNIGGVGSASSSYGSSSLSTSCFSDDNVLKFCAAERIRDEAPPNIFAETSPTLLAASFRLKEVMSKLQPTMTAIKTMTAAIAPTAEPSVCPSSAPNQPPAPPSASTPVKASGPLVTCKIPKLARTTPPQPKASFIRFGVSSARR